MDLSSSSRMGGELSGETVLTNDKMVNLPPVFRKDGATGNLQILEAADGEVVLKRQGDWKDGQFDLSLSLKVASGSAEGKMVVVLDLSQEMFASGEIAFDTDEETDLATVFGSSRSRTIPYKSEVSSTVLSTSQGKKYRLEFSNPAKADLTYWSDGSGERVRLRFYVGEGGYLSDADFRMTARQADK